MPFFSSPQHGRRETAVLYCGLQKNGMAGAWHGHCMASVKQTRPHCVNQMRKTHSKPLAARHGRGTTWVRHGHGMLCVNQPQYSSKTNWGRKSSEKLQVSKLMCLLLSDTVFFFIHACDISTSLNGSGIGHNVLCSTQISGNLQDLYTAQRIVVHGKHFPSFLPFSECVGSIITVCRHVKKTVRHVCL